MQNYKKTALEELDFNLVPRLVEIEMLSFIPKCYIVWLNLKLPLLSDIVWNTVTNRGGKMSNP